MASPASDLAIVAGGENAEELLWLKVYERAIARVGKLLMVMRKVENCRPRQLR